MKVILLDDVRKLGQEGDVVTVKDGYAVNFLIPNGLAKQATPSALKAQKHFDKAAESKHEQNLKKAEEIKERMKDLKLVFKVKVGEEDRMFGSVTAANIAEAMTEQGFETDKRHVGIDQPITSLGEHEVSVKLFRGIYAPVSVLVEDQDKEEKEAKAQAEADRKQKKADEAKAQNQEEKSEEVKEEQPVESAVEQEVQEQQEAQEEASQQVEEAVEQSQEA